MTTWACSHDPSHPTVESDIYPSFCLALIGARMKCSAHMEVRPTEQRPSDPATQQTAKEGTKHMALITVNSGAPDIDPGTYTVTLTGIEGPRTIIPQRGPNAGKEVSIFDWTFSTEDGQEIQATTSMSSGPRSKMYSWLTALFGAAPPVGSSFDATDLIGRMAIATISVDEESGWPKVANLGAVPVVRKPKAVEPEPVAAPVAVAEPDDDTVPDLPWK